MRPIYRKVSFLRRSRAMWGNTRVWRPRLVFWAGALAIGVVSVLFAKLADIAQETFHGVTGTSGWTTFLPLIQGAIRSLNAAVAHAPSGKVYNKLGTAYILLGQTENAETAFSKALSMEPGKLDTRTNLALAQAVGGKFPVAASTMQDVVNSPLVERRQLINYAVILRMSGRTDEARAVNVPEMTAAGKETILRQAANAVTIKDRSGA